MAAPAIFGGPATASSYANEDRGVEGAGARLVVRATTAGYRCLATEC
ncbi:hypothetical protein [uncultured Actinomyces sp.]|nr:hypothetical protein [uncultured Actinomyces sp.]